MVCASLEVAGKLAPLAAQAPSMSSDEFKQAYEDLLFDVQGHL
jgi:hypothetical protein